MNLVSECVSHYVLPMAVLGVSTRAVSICPHNSHLEWYRNIAPKVVSKILVLFLKRSIHVTLQAGTDVMWMTSGAESDVFLTTFTFSWSWRFKSSSPELWRRVVLSQKTVTWKSTSFWLHFPTSLRKFVVKLFSPFYNDPFAYLEVSH
jgi:hypothetical protein